MNYYKDYKSKWEEEVKCKESGEGGSSYGESPPNSLDKGGSNIGKS